MVRNVHLRIEFPSTDFHILFVFFIFANTTVHVVYKTLTFHRIRNFRLKFNMLPESSISPDTMYSVHTAYCLLFMCLYLLTFRTKGTNMKKKNYALKCDILRKIAFFFVLRFFSSAHRSGLNSAFNLWLSGKYNKVIIIMGNRVIT